MVDESVVTSVRRYLRTLARFGMVVRAGIVFGSQVHGNVNAWSDVDLLVISPRFDGPVSRRDVDLLWRVAAQVDSRIEPVPCGEQQWMEDDWSTLVEVARREGHTITVHDDPPASPATTP